MILEAMKDATDFEIFVWKYQSVHTIGEMRRAWDASLQDIRDAMDKGCRLNWSAIPMKQIPDITPPKPAAIMPHIRISRQQLRNRRIAAIHTDIYERYRAGEAYYNLAQQYGYPISTIYWIVRKMKLKEEESQCLV